MLLHKNHREHHSERPERVMSIWLNLYKKEILKDMFEIDAEPEPAEEDILLCHTK